MPLIILKKGLNIVMIIRVLLFRPHPASVITYETEGPRFYAPLLLQYFIGYGVGSFYQWIIYE